MRSGRENNMLYKREKNPDPLLTELWAFRPDLETKLFIEDIANWRGISKSEAIRECIKGYAILLQAFSEVNEASEMFREYIREKREPRNTQKRT